eukprot:5921107-Amphidinium_carterae.1
MSRLGDTISSPRQTDVPSTKVYANRRVPNVTSQCLQNKYAPTSNDAFISNHRRIAADGRPSWLKPLDSGRTSVSFQREGDLDKYVTICGFVPQTFSCEHPKCHQCKKQV